MSTTKYPYGSPVKLLTELQGFPDGRLVQFEVWKKEGQKEEKIADVNGVTRNGKGIAIWTPSFKERKETLSLTKTETQQTQQVKYFFKARIDDKEIKSSDMEFLYSLAFHLQDARGKPINGVECSVTFSDGSKKKTIISNGQVKFDDVPPGKFKIELKGYEFVFE